MQNSQTKYPSASFCACAHFCGNSSSVLPSKRTLTLCIGSLRIDGAGNDVVEPEKVFGKVCRESADDRDGDVQAPVRRVSVGDKDIVANPDVLIAARRRVGLHRRVKSASKRPKLEDASFRQECFEPVEVFAGVVGSDEPLDLGAVDDKCRSSICVRELRSERPGSASSRSASLTSAWTRLW